jgi:hypothetical protein
MRVDTVIARSGPHVVVTFGGMEDHHVEGFAASKVSARTSPSTKVMFWAAG